MKTLTTAAILAVFATGARADTLRLSGHLGASVASIDGATAMRNDLLDTSYLRLQGEEVLSPGLHALFRVSSPVNLPTGEQGGTFDDTYVGLEQAGAARLTLGRQFPAAIDAISDYLDVYEVSGSSVHVLPLALLATNPFRGYAGRINHSAKLRLTVHGLSLAASAASADTAGASYAAAAALPLADCQLAAVWLRNAGGAAAPGAVHRFSGVGSNCTFGQARLYGAAYLRRLEQDGKGQRQDVILHGGVRQALSAQLDSAIGVYWDQMRDLQRQRQGSKRNIVASLTYAFSATSKATVMGFANRMTGTLRDDPVNAAALGLAPGTGRSAGWAFTLGQSF